MIQIKIILILMHENSKIIRLALVGVGMIIFKIAEFGLMRIF